METVICNCTGVTKGMIVEAINAGGLTTVDQVASATESTTFCGSCAEQVEDILSEVNA